MGAGFVAALVLATARQQPDTATFDSPATAQLISRAMARHHAQDSSVRDYQAKIRYRLSFSLGRRRWAAVPTAAVEEQEGRIAWQLPNDLRVDILGQRSRARNPEWDVNSRFDEPWFVPRGLSDSVRTFGADFPERAALHPLAADAADWYRYAQEDSVTIRASGGRPLRLTALRITPKRPGHSLIAGRMWLDSETGEVVRIAFRYVGADLWVAPERETRKDSSKARRANRLINRILSIDSDLEYALQDNKYWMPYRQILSGKVQVPFVGDYVIPFEAVTTFSDYEINSGQSIAFQLPPPDTSYRGTVAGRRSHRDSLYARRRREARRDSLGARSHAGYSPGGRFEIHSAHRDSLRQYRDWGDTLRLELSDDDHRRIQEVQNDLARMVDEMPNAITGLGGLGFGYERLADMLRYNRVQGWSAGLGYQLPIRGLSFTSLYGTGRFGTSDRRLTGRVSVVRDAPKGKITLAVYHDLQDADPFARGLSFGNSIRAIVSTRDEGDYYLASGASISREQSVARGVELSIGLRAERHRSVVRRAKSEVNDFFFGDGIFAPNPPIADGDYLGATARLDGMIGRARWSLTADALRGDTAGGARFYTSIRQPVFGRRGVTFRLHAGVATNDHVPQLGFRAGGQSSVRGFDFDTQRGNAAWSLQSDWSPLRTRAVVRPVVFVDAGQAGPVGDLTRQPVLVGGGAGLSALSGLVRLDLSHRISNHPALRERGGFRVDLVFGAPR